MSKHPAYTLAKVKTFRGMEGQGFSATLVRVADKAAIAEVLDEGRGGAMRIVPANAAAYAEYVAYVAPLKLSFMFDGGMVEITTEKEAAVIEDILDDLKWQKRIEKVAKAAVVYRKPGDPIDAFRKMPLNGRTREGLTALIKQNCPDVIIIA